MDSVQPIIAGVDEAGRGALAGPVVAGACVLRRQTRLPAFIRDSKQLTSAERTLALRWITKNTWYGVGIVAAADIDRIGILEATQLAMQTAVTELAKVKVPTYLLVDGCDQFWFDYAHSSIIRGDSLEPCISAASIVAKVYRDRLMKKMNNNFVQYAFRQHKGYGTPAHIKAILEYGPSSEHRRTFLRRIQGDDQGAVSGGGFSPGRKAVILTELA